MSSTLIRGRDVDRRCSRPRGWANRQARAGRIPHILLPDGQIRFDPALIESWLAKLATLSMRRLEVANANN